MRKFIGALFVLCYVAQPLHAYADESGTALVMQSPGSGVYFTYVSTNGVGLFYPKIGLHIAMHKPDWNIILFNDTTKTYQVQSRGERSDGTPASHAQDLARRAAVAGIRKGPTAIIAGHKATQYLIHTMSASGPKLAEVWTTAELPGPPQLNDMYGKLYRIDTSSFPPGLPVRMKLSDEAGHRELLFDAVRSEPKKISSSRLKEPTGYRYAKSESEIIGGKGLAGNKSAGTPAEIETRDLGLIRGPIPEF